MKQYPRIYDAHMRPLGDLRTAEFTDLKQRQTPFDTVTLTVPTADAGSFGYRQFVELFDSDGKRIDIFRVSEVPKKTYAPDGMMRMTCDQALCTLKDGLVPGYHQFGGTTQNLRGAIESVLAYQSEPLWALERCDFDTHYEYGICDESPYTALLMLLEPIPDAMIVTDTTQRPWKLSVVRMTDEDASELRYSRNMEEVVETIQDGFFATRLFPRGYGEGVNQLTICDVNGGVEYIEAPQAVRDTWGTVSEPYINTTITDALTLKAEAEVALELCQTPNVSYKVKAADLSKLTGEPLDAFYKGRMVRMIYRETGLVVRTRVTEIHKPKPKAEPWNAKLTLSTQPQSVATIIADLARQSKIQNTYGQGSTFIYADSFEQNCDKDTPAEGDIYIPESMIHVNAIMLKVTASAYRADSKGAAGGGGTVQSTKTGGGGTQTSEAGGLATVTVKAQTVSTGIKNTGSPLDDDGGICTNTGLPTDLLGARITKTENYEGSTAEAGGDIGVSVPILNGEVMSYTGEDGPTSTGSASGNTGTPIGVASGAAMTETGTGGPLFTGDGGGGSTGSASGNTGTPIGTASGTAMTETGTGGPTTTGEGGSGGTGITGFYSGTPIGTASGEAMTETGTGGPTATGSGGPTSTGSTSSNTGTPIGTSSGNSMTETGTGGPTITGKGGPTSTGSASGNTGTPLNTSSGESMTSTGTGGPTSTGNSSPGTNEAGSDISTSAAKNNGNSMANTGAASPGTSSGGSHSHTVNSHSHTYSFSVGISHNHRISSGAGATGGIYSGVSKVAVDSKSTGTKSPGTDERGSHSHTVDSHTHSMAHYHTLSTKHSHTVNSHNHSVEQHTHGMNHYHAIGSHNHSVDAHSHSVEQHTHGMNHYHAIGSHSHSVDTHSHSVEQHTHGMNHYHYVQGHSHSVSAHSHSVEQHTHGMNHYHEGGSHSHSLGSHKHSVEQHTHGMNHYHAGGSHSHSIAQHKHLMAHTHTLTTRHSHSITHAHDFDHIHNMAHVHNMEHNHTIPQQSIEIPSHSHNVSIPSHSHEIELADHEHSIIYGIFKGPIAAAYVVEVDGTAIPASVFSDQGIGDIAPYLKTDDRGKILRGTFHTLAVRPTASEDNPNGLCRIRASWSAQVFISSLTGKQY